MTTVDRHRGGDVHRERRGRAEAAARAPLERRAQQRHRPRRTAVRARISTRALANLEQRARQHDSRLLRRPAARAAGGSARRSAVHHADAKAQSERLYGERRSATGCSGSWKRRPKACAARCGGASFDAENGPIKRLERAGWTLVDWRDFTAPWRRDPIVRARRGDRRARDAARSFAAARPTSRHGDNTEDASPVRRDHARRRVDSWMTSDAASRVRPRDYDGLEARLVLAD